MRSFLRGGDTLRLLAVAVAVALVSGATGAVAGNLITGADIKDGTIKGRDIKNRTIAGKDLKRKLRRKINKSGTAGASGVPGEQGPAGPVGPTGATGANGNDGVDGGNGSKVGPIGFERSSFLTGNINGQNGWTKTGPYDVEVVDTSAFPDASGNAFGDQALRLSDAVTSGSFGDQTFSRGLPDEAGEPDSYNAGYAVATCSRISMRAS